MESITSLPAAVQYFLEMLQQHPEWDMVVAEQAVAQGKRRRYPALTINHLVDPDDTFTPSGEMVLPEVRMSPGPESKLA